MPKRELPEAEAVFLTLLRLSQLFKPLVVSAASLGLLRRFTTFSLPVWAIAVVATASVPVYHTAHIMFTTWNIKRKAASLGAQLPPRFEGKSFGNLDILALLNRSFEEDYLSETLWNAMHTLGPTFEVYILWDRAYATSDAEFVKAMLATDFNTWVKGDKFDEAARAVLGTGVFNSDGEMWKFHRSMTRPFFTRERISHFELFNRHADVAMAKMRERLASGYAVDFQDLIARFTLDSATEFLFASCVHSLENVLHLDLTI